MKPRETKIGDGFGDKAHERECTPGSTRSNLATAILLFSGAPALVFNVMTASDSAELGALDPTFVAPIDDRFRRMQTFGRYARVARTWTTHRYRGPRGSRISLQPWLTRRPP